MIETIRRWHKNAPAPVIWLAAMVIIFVWVVLLSIFGAFLEGGFSAVASSTPDYLYKTSVNFLRVYLMLLGLYVLFRLAVYAFRYFDRQ